MRVYTSDRETGIKFPFLLLLLLLFFHSFFFRPVSRISRPPDLSTATHDRTENRGKIQPSPRVRLSFLAIGLLLSSLLILDNVTRLVSSSRQTPARSFKRWFARMPRAIAIIETTDIFNAALHAAVCRFAFPFRQRRIIGSRSRFLAGFRPEERREAVRFATIGTVT